MTILRKSLAAVAAALVVVVVLLLSVTAAAQRVRVNGIGSGGSSSGGGIAVNVKTYGAYGDTRMVKDAALNGTTTVTSATAAFTPGDVGKIIYGVETATRLLRLPRGTITGYNSATSVTVSVAAVGTYSGVWLVWGHDDADPIRSAVAAAYAMSPPGKVYLPAGGYLTTKLLFDISHPSGGGGAIRDTFSVEGDGSNNSIIYIDPAFDFNTTSANAGAIARNITGGNVRNFKMSGLTIEGANAGLSAASYYALQLYAPKSSYHDIRVLNVAGFASAVYLLGNESIVTRMHVEGSSGTGVSVASGMTIIGGYFGNNGGDNVQAVNIDTDANTGDPLQIIGGVIDEGGSSSLAVLNADIILMGVTAYSFVNQSAVYVDGSSSVRAYGTQMTSYATSGNRSGMTVLSGGRVWLTGCILSKSGTGLALNNSGTVYDGGGNDLRGNVVTGNAMIGQISATDFRMFGFNASATSFASGNLRVAPATVTLSGASTATGNIIPAGAIVIGVATTVTTAITGASGYTVGDGTDVDRWGDITGTAIGTDSDNSNATANPFGAFLTPSAVTLTAKTANFTGGVVQVVVFYLTTSAE